MDVPDVGLNGAPEPLDIDATEIVGGSTDTADVSWVVPAIEFSVVTVRPRRAILSSAVWKRDCEIVPLRAMTSRPMASRLS